MEKLGFERALEDLLHDGLEISTVATDRHMGIWKLLRENYPEIDHQFDVWHISKSITKKLTAKAKRKGCEDLGPWIRAVTSHRSHIMCVISTSGTLVKNIMSVPMMQLTLRRRGRQSG